METDNATPNADARRETIVFGHPVDYTGGIRHFDASDGVDTDTLRELVDGDYMLPYGHNAAPTPEEFIDFGDAVEDTGATIRFTGYVVSPDRPDVRVSVTGYKITGASTTTFGLAMDHRHADEFHVDHDDGYISAWWD